MRQRLAGAALALTLSLGSAGAQNLGAYQKVTAALEAAVQDRSGNALQSLADVDRATDAFNQLAQSLDSAVVVDGTRVAIKNARIAVGRSQTDLEAQVAQVRGLLRRGLYEQLLSDLPHASSAGLGLLAQEFSLSSAESQELTRAAAANNGDLAVTLLERAAASHLEDSLQRAEPARPTSAYLETARALGWFTVVQDSPRSAGLSSAAFASALGQVTSNQRTAFARTRTDLLARAKQFVAASGVAVTAARAHQPLPQTGRSTPGPAATPSTRPSPAPSTRGGSVVPGGAAGTLDLALLDALDRAGQGDVRGAQGSLNAAVAGLNRLPQRLRRAAAFPAFEQGLRAAAAKPFLRPADVRAQIGALANLRDSAAGRPASLLNAASAALQAGWGGWLSGIVWLLLALAAFYPLYLLNLAFGGRNPYWRAIGVAFALLLAPAVLEGLASLGAWLGAVSGFGALANFSLLQTPLASLVWALSVAGAIGLGTYGFRGLCVQFGLLRGAGAGAGAAREAQAAPSTVEWDEEV